MGVLDFLNPILKTVEKLVPDADLRVKLQAELTTTVIQAEVEIAKAASEVVKTEAASEHWLVSSWRPLTMLSFVLIMLNNYLIQPYCAAFGWNVPILDLPPDMWSLLQIGIGGYVVSRGAEKVAASLGPALGRK